MWGFHDFPGAFPVEVTEVVPDQRIVRHWAANEDGKPAGYQTTVTMEFKPTDDGRTLVEIEEKCWLDSQAGLKASYGNCVGWA